MPKCAATLSILLSLIMTLPAQAERPSQDALLAQRLRFENRFAEAITLCNKNIERAKSEEKKAGWYALRGSIKTDTHDYGGALADLQTALQSPALKDKPDTRAHYYWRIGEIYRLQHKPKEAIAKYSESLKLDNRPDKYYLASTYFARGQMELEIKEAKGALSDFDSAIKAVDTVIKTSNSKSRIITARTDKIKFLYARAKALELLGRADEAKRVKQDADKLIDEL